MLQQSAVAVHLGVHRRLRLARHRRVLDLARDEVSELLQLVLQVRDARLRTRLLFLQRRLQGVLVLTARGQLHQTKQEQLALLTRARVMLQVSVRMSRSS